MPTRQKLLGTPLCLAVLFFVVSTFAGHVPDVVQNQCIDNMGNPIICPSSGQSFIIDWGASFAINSNLNIRRDLNQNDLRIPPMPLPEIMVQHKLPPNRMINDDPFSNPNNWAIQELPLLPSYPTRNIHKLANHEWASSPINISSNTETTGATISGNVYQSDTCFGNYVEAYTGSAIPGGILKWRNS